MPDNEHKIPVAELYASVYPTGDADMHDLLIRAQNLPLPDGPFQLNYFHLADTVIFDLFPRNVLMMLERVVTERLLPDFWHRVINGECPSDASRIACLRLRQIFLLNFSFLKARSNCTLTQWRRVLGLQDDLPLPLLPLDGPSGELEECPICRVSLNETDEEGIPVKTQCNHIFHKNCITSWLTDSPNGDCPSCRRAIRNFEPIPPFLVHGTIPEWLRVLLNEPENGNEAEAEDRQDDADTVLDIDGIAAIALAMLLL